MGVSYAYLIAEMHDSHNAAQTHLGTARYWLGRADSHWWRNEDHECLEDIMTAVMENNHAAEHTMEQGFYGYNGATNIIPTALDPDMACPFIDAAPPTEITLDDILNAMISADFAQLQAFIGIVDAYRVSLWNEPFNVEYYAALARGFQP